jgi:hypothetical protein
VLPGSSIRAKAAEEATRKAIEEAPKPPLPPDPNEVAVRAWVVRDETTFESLLALIDASIRFHAAERRGAVASHPTMAFHEGQTAALEALKLKLTNLRSGQA